MKFKGKVRPCWQCNASITFLPTSTAPKGAWVNAGTDVHHRCNQTAQGRRKLPLPPPTVEKKSFPASAFPSTPSVPRFVLLNPAINIRGMSNKLDWNLMAKHKALIKASAEKFWAKQPNYQVVQSEQIDAQQLRHLKDIIAS